MSSSAETVARDASGGVARDAAGGGARDPAGAVARDARVHPTADVEPGVVVGARTAIWDHVHVRAPARIGTECIIGGKTYIAGEVEIGDRVKLNAFVYVCSGVTIERGVMAGAGTIFTNDRFPRATTPDLAELRPSEVDEHTLPTLVREGASIGAGSIIGCGIELGRFAMVGMGSVVSRTVPDFHLVVGSPARTIGCVCRCGEPFVRCAPGEIPRARDAHCPACDRVYDVDATGHVTEHAGGPEVEPASGAGGGAS